MGLSIRNALAERLAREVAAKTGENLTDAIIHSLEEWLHRLEERPGADETVEAIMEISRRCSALPDLDVRHPDEILGYDDTGVPA